MPIDDRVPRVLIVDDDPQSLLLHSVFVREFGYTPETAADGLEALEKLPEGFDLILLDAQMPNMDGFEFAARVRETEGHDALPIVMVTGLAAQEDLMKAYSFGINDFVTKPVDPDELKLRLRWLIQLKLTRDELAAHQASLEHTVEVRTRELRRALAEVNEARHRTHEAHLDTIRRLTLAAEYKDSDTAMHITRTGLYSEVVGRAIGLPVEVVEVLPHATPMHDVGKLGIPDGVLLKPGPLTDEEMATMRTHTTIGAQILSGSNSPVLQMGERIALSHHERWDGGGYPHGIAGEQIPIEGRICAVVDFFDALTQHRPYRRAMSVETTIEMIREGSAAHFDPALVEAFCDALSEILEIKKAYPDH